MFNTPQETLKARKPHKCTNCAEAIEPGEAYVRWTTMDGACFVSKMHPECLDALQEDAGEWEWEYTPYSGERPAKVAA